MGAPPWYDRRVSGSPWLSVLAPALVITMSPLSSAKAGWARSGRPLVRRCLERDPQRRLRDVSDGLLQIEEALEPLTTHQRAAEGARPGESRRCGARPAPF